MQNLRNLFRKKPKNESSTNPETSREEILRAMMFDIILTREEPTRFEYITSEGERVAIWFDNQCTKADEQNFERFEGAMESGDYSFIPEDLDGVHQTLVEGLGSTLAKELGTSIKINDAWFDSVGKKADRENSLRFESQIESLPLNKITS